jgi:hydrogenase-4 component E
MTDFLLVLFGVTLLFTAATSRIEGYIKALAVQGIILFLMVLADFGRIEPASFLFLSIETFVFKTIIIPVIMVRIVRKNNIIREVEPSLPSFYSVLIVSLIFAFGFFISYWSMKNGNNIRPLYFGVSMSVIMAALFIIMTRKKIITHVMGYMILENGIFLLSLSVAKEMPLIVNMGVLLDVFIGIYLLGLFVNKIKVYYDEDHIDTLTDLKD